MQNQNEVRIHKCVPTSSSVFHWFIMSLSIYHNQWRQFLTVCLASSNWWWTSASSASNFRRIFSKSWQAWHDINISNQILESRHFQLSVDIQCVRTTDLFLHCQPMSDTVLLRHRYYPFNRTDSKRDEISWRYLHHRDFYVNNKKKSISTLDQLVAYLFWISQSFFEICNESILFSFLFGQAFSFLLFVGESLICLL